MDVGGSAWILRWMLDSQNDWKDRSPKGDIYGYQIFIDIYTIPNHEACWCLLKFDIVRPLSGGLAFQNFLGRKECPMVADAFWWWLPCLSPRIPAEGFQRLKACVASEGVLVEVFCTLVDTWTLGALPSSWSSWKLPKNPSNCSVVLSVPRAGGYPP